MKIILSLIVLFGSISVFANEQCPNLSGTYELTHAGSTVTQELKQDGCKSLTSIMAGEKTRTYLLNGVQAQVDTHLETSKWEDSKAVYTMVSPDSECYYTSKDGEEIYFHTSIESMALQGNTLVIDEVGYDKDGKQLYQENLKAIRK